MTIGIAFHEPVSWTDWLLYEHESTAVGAGMSFVRGQVFTLGGNLLASFHPSMQNTNTGRLTAKMFAGIFRRAKKLAGLTE